MSLAISNLLSQFKLSRLVLALCSLVIITMLISAVLSINSVRNGVVAVEHKSLIRHVSSLAKVVAKLPKKEKLKEVLYASRWHSDNSGYAFLADGTTGRYLVYPPRPAAEGNNMAVINLIEGGTLEQAIQRSSKQGIAEMVHYQHSKPGMNKKTLKAAYLYPIKQGGAVLIVGEYLDQSEVILLNIYQKIFAPMAIISIFIIISSSLLSRYLNRRTEYLSKAMSRLANGNLCETVVLQGKDEMAFLANKLNICQASLARILKQQAENGTNIATASLQIDSNLNNTNKLICSELSNLDQLASAMEEVVCSVAEVAENAVSASSNAQSTEQRTHQGEKQIRQCITAINELCENLQNCAQSVNEVKNGVLSIDSVVELINGISEQTNMLALNAAIEAARAGEYGRGFAVVADEVRQLASRTQDATKEITKTIATLNNQAFSAVTLVDASAHSAETGMNAARAASDEFKAITEKVSALNDSNLQIATAAEQQRNVALTMSQNINQLNGDLAETSNDLNELAKAGSSLKEQADILDTQLSSFDFEHGARQPTTAEKFSDVALDTKMLDELS